MYKCVTMHKYEYNHNANTEISFKNQIKVIVKNVSEKQAA